jgi:16S rRNA (cytidine1402-2'-O)-methyltransferase
MAILYIVSTPVGNLEDITHRAVTVLKSADRVLAEDTRRTAILFRRYDIGTPLVSAHEHNEAARAARIVGWLDDGETIALVSDAGTPLLSDPGARIVRAVLDAGHRVVPVPGASALLAALVVSGLPAEPFTFYGFLPRSGRERTARLGELAQLGHTAVLYEAPGRLAALLEDLAAACGAGRRAAVARELTKLHETVLRGTIGELLDAVKGTTVRGEIVVLVAGAAAVERADAAGAAAQRLAAELLAAGESPRSAAREIARRLRIPRNRAYAAVLSVAGGSDEAME